MIESFSDWGFLKVQIRKAGVIKEAHDNHQHLIHRCQDWPHLACTVARAPLAHATTQEVTTGRQAKQPPPEGDPPASDNNDTASTTTTTSCATGKSESHALRNTTPDICDIERQHLRTPGRRILDNSGLGMCCLPVATKGGGR
jgi:hypothetical protein